LGELTFNTGRSTLETSL